MEFKNVSVKRSNNMKAIKSVSKLEDEVSKALWKNGVRYRRNVKSLFGNPDFAIKKYKIVIFIDSCFWHACPIHGNKPKNNKEYWEKKLIKNTKRDIIVNNFYKSNGWHIFRVWEHDLKSNFDFTIKEIINFINSVK
ncbi:very short patch repair endonuclease [Planococcus beijingensis]|uniref:very short patch repair endonuclease n=1 Tax=Planococcus beijingensis TaxID=2782551 RepID=UPI00193AFA55|nr:very short patch repair endonuclease [Planococcus beijingensis]